MKSFVKNHKKEIAIAGTLTALVGIGIVIWRVKSKKILETSLNFKILNTEGSDLEKYYPEIYKQVIEFGKDIYSKLKSGPFENGMIYLEPDNDGNIFADIIR